ncbi:MAG TPA: hypothetical protein DEQ30_03420, partial [Porphyromonadaceae bacterium]|nr:hypothetical protein [Porphyromonadaceae bacterium]
ITTGGSLTLGNVAVYTASAYVSRYIQMDAGTLTLNNGSELMTYGKYGVYQTGGDVVMNSGSLIKSMPTTSSISSNTYGIYLSGSTATLTLESGSMIKDQYYGIRLAGTNHVEIKDSAVISYTRYPIEISGAGILNIGKARLESTNS